MKMACVQINSGADMPANIEKVSQWTRQASAQGANCVALPENVFLMEEPGLKTARTLYTEEEHPGVLAAKQMAKQHACWILVGSVSVQSDVQGKALNRSLVINPQGDITERYDKIHLFDVTLPDGETYAESSRMMPGQTAVVTQIQGIPTGLSICYDVRFPHLYRALAKKDAQILMVPAAFTAVTGEAHWHVLLRARAIENGCFVVAAAQTGTHPGNRRTYGHALIIDPWGKIIADAGTEEGLIIADLDMDQVEKIRARIPSLQHDRAFDLNS